jgi:hypothetical protein
LIHFAVSCCIVKSIRYSLIFMCIAERLDTKFDRVARYRHPSLEDTGGYTGRGEYGHPSQIRYTEYTYGVPHRR